MMMIIKILEAGDGLARFAGRLSKMGTVLQFKPQHNSVTKL